MNTAKFPKTTRKRASRKPADVPFDRERIRQDLTALRTALLLQAGILADLEKALGLRAEPTIR